MVRSGHFCLPMAWSVGNVCVIACSMHEVQWALGVGRSEEGRGQAAGACCRSGGSGCGGSFSGSCCGPGGSCCGPAGRDGGGKGESRAEAAVRFAPEGAAACGQADRGLAVGSCSMRSQFLSAMRSPRVEYSQHSNGMPNVVHCIFLGLISM